MSKKILGLTFLELALIEIFIYVLMWVVDEYFATLFSILAIFIFIGVLLLSWAAEWIEPSKVPKSYFQFLYISIICPILVFAIYYWINGQEISWILE